MDSTLEFVHLYNVDPTKIYDRRNDRRCLILIGLIVSTKMDVALYYLLYRTVLIQECTIDIFNIIGDHTCDLSKRLAMQVIYFSSAYFLIWMFWYVLIVHNTLFYVQPEWIWIMNAIFLPIQGLYNLIVYLRPRYLSFR